MFINLSIDHPYAKPPEGVDVVWRAEFHSYAYCVDPDMDRWASTGPKLEIRWYRVDRRTPKGAFVHGCFCLLTAKRSRYRNTAEEALDSLLKRREAQVRILEKSLTRARLELDMARRALEGTTAKTPAPT